MLGTGCTQISPLWITWLFPFYWCGNCGPADNVLGTRLSQGWQVAEPGFELEFIFFHYCAVSFLSFKGSLQQNIAEKQSFLEKLRSVLEWIMMILCLKYDVFTAKSRCVMWLLKLLFTDAWHYPSDSWPSSHISISSSSSSYLWNFFFLTLSFAFENLVRTTFLKIRWGSLLLLTALGDFGEES